MNLEEWIDIQLNESHKRLIQTKDKEFQRGVELGISGFICDLKNKIMEYKVQNISYEAAVQYQKDIGLM